MLKDTVAQQAIAFARSVLGDTPMPDVVQRVSRTSSLTDPVEAGRLIAAEHYGCEREMTALMRAPSGRAALLTGR